MAVTATRVNTPDGSPVHGYPGLYKEVWDVASDNDGGSVNINYTGQKFQNIDAQNFQYVDVPASRYATLTARVVKQLAILGTIFSKTSSAALALVTGLSLNVEAGKKYKFKAVLHIDAGATGGYLFAINGTATATAIIAKVAFTSHSDKALDVSGRLVALGGAGLGDAGSTAGDCIIEGEITVNAAGTLAPYFAQNVSNGTASSVLVGSTFEVETMNHTERVNIYSV